MIFKKAALVFIVIAVIAVLVSVLPRESRHLAASTLCDKAMTIVRNDDYTNFAEAYMNFKEAIMLNSNFALPYIGLLELNKANSPGSALHYAGRF